MISPPLALMRRGTKGFWGCELFVAIRELCVVQGANRRSAAVSDLQSPMRHKGRIIEWNDDKGYGFISPATGGDRVFVHISSFLNQRRRPVSGDIVVFETSTDTKGRLQGTRIAYSGDSALPASAPGPGKASMIFAALFLLVVAGMVVAGNLPPFVLIVYFTASAITFLAYAWDKAAARNNDWRTQESTLHLLGLLGGWPGALVAQRLLRHKSTKQSFQAAFWVTVVVNCCAFAYILATKPFSR
jgi:uncharacterized membrane protein YsdA (DUF1294 family)/cold shock CspA family protein